MIESRKRCGWCGSDPLYVRYHDEEWGVPVHVERTLFEFLILEGAQAGLSWITILKKREAYREAFHGFDPERVARMTARERGRLLVNPAIVRNRLKIEAAVRNARATLALRDEVGGLARHAWSFVGGRPIQGRRRTLRDVPTTSPEAEAFSRDLRRRDFTFVGPTIMYAFMQATGMVNDHLLGCFRRRPVALHSHSMVAGGFDEMS